MSLNFSVFIRFKRSLLAVVLSACVLLLPAAWGQAPLLSDNLNVLDAGELVVFEWRKSAADRALSSGLAVLAEDLYDELLQEPSISEVQRAELQIQLAGALIVQRRFVAAREVLELVAEIERTDKYYLYLGISAYGDGRSVDKETLRVSLSRVLPQNLEPANLPWYHLLRGLQFEVRGNVKAVRAAFDKARSTTVSAAQRAFLDSLILREEILNSESTIELAEQARTQLELLRGTAAAYPYVRQYAIILYNLGRNEDAIDLIGQELVNSQAGYSAREREQLLLLKGILYGVNTLSGRDVLRGLVREGRNREVMAMSLQLLARGTSDLERKELAFFLDEMIAKGDSHSLLGQMYYMRSQLSLAQGDTLKAEEDAQLLLEQFPGLSEITNVYRLLAYAALQREPPQYRAAADFLSQLRDQTEDPEERRGLNRLIGDCYFLNNDYRNAVDFYQAARFKGVGVDRDGELFLRLVTAEVRDGQIESALQQIDEADFSGSISDSYRWRAEWNVAQALLSLGKLEEALQRVRLLLGDDSVETVPTSLQLRLRWLEARLALMTGDTAGVLARVDTLLARIESIPVGESFDPTEARLLRTEVLLLKADILIGAGDFVAGMEALEPLRTGFAESSAAERSYLTEASYHASTGDFKAAQETLTKLASIYGKSELAPQALFEAALYCERRGPDSFKEAVKVHHQLTERYPKDPLCYSARLKQGDLLRQMNDFAAAQSIYENLIQDYPEHARRYLAELSRADCLLALAKENDERLKDVALVLERLIDLPNLPIDSQAEVGYKWGFALMQRGALDEAQVVFALIYDRFLNGENATRLGETGRYWMSRALLALGTCLEESGELLEARSIYRKMVAFNLPGRNLAQARAERLPVVD